MNPGQWTDPEEIKDGTNLLIVTVVAHEVYWFARGAVGRTGVQLLCRMLIMLALLKKIDLGQDIHMCSTCKSALSRILAIHLIVATCCAVVSCANDPVANDNGIAEPTLIEVLELSGDEWELVEYINIELATADRLYIYHHGWHEKALSMFNDLLHTKVVECVHLYVRDVQNDPMSFGRHGSFVLLFSPQWDDVSPSDYLACSFAVHQWGEGLIGVAPMRSEGRHDWRRCEERRHINEGIYELIIIDMREEEFWQLMNDIMAFHEQNNK